MDNMSGDVSVVARVRPQLDGEPGKAVVHTSGEGSISLIARREVFGGKDCQPRAEDKVHQFCFKRVHVYEDNATVYHSSVAPIVASALAGGRGACFAYGYSGTGKTATIYGRTAEVQAESPEKDHDCWEGIAAIAAKDLLAEVATCGVDYVLRVSMCEVAGRECRDLLAGGSILKLRSLGDGKVYVRAEAGGPPCRKTVRDLTAFDEVLAAGIATRRVGKSTVHDASSRSHAVIEFDVVTNEIITLEQEIESAEARVREEANKRDDDLRERARVAYSIHGHAAFAGTELGREMEQLGAYHTSLSTVVDKLRTKLRDTTQAAAALVRGRLAFIDMAGNDWEKAADVQTNLSHSEQAAINTSLLAVKECLRAAASMKHSQSSNGKQTSVKGRSIRIPYRNSVLTHLLQRHFVPDAHLLMVATITPSDDTRLVRQSINTLNYAKLVWSPSSPAASHRQLNKEGHDGRKATEHQSS
ncbi:unnamed protein product [Choristocarpus tenellus]